MKEQVRVRVRTACGPPGEGAGTDLRGMNGHFYEKGEMRFLIYDEPADPDGGAAHVLLRIRGDRLEISRRSEDASLRLLLFPGQDTQAVWHTPFGRALLQVRTERLEITAPASGKLRITAFYGLRMGGGPAGTDSGQDQSSGASGASDESPPDVLQYRIEITAEEV